MPGYSEEIEKAIAGTTSKVADKVGRKEAPANL
jgi:hypothetical protein